MGVRVRFLLFLAVGWSAFAARYTGPHPPKPDVPYLLHGGRLIETEAGDARQEDKKNDVTYTIAGENSPARTPLAEPIFLIEAQNTNPERYEMYKVESRNGHREITMTAKRRRGGGRPIHLMVTPLAEHLYRLEADEPLENGDYCLSPTDTNKVYCFTIF